MDPYLEKYPYWSDFAPQFLTAIRNALTPRVLPKYEVRIEEYVVVMHEDIRLHRARPDVMVDTEADWKPASAGGVAVAGPHVVELEYPDLDPITQRYLKVIERPNRRIVTVMELLSPVNKQPGEDGIEMYVAKRAEYLASQCHLVEIDLLRRGERLPMRGLLPSGDYFVYVGRCGRKPRGQVVGWDWKSPMPNISIPLLPEDPEVDLNLQTVFQSAYEPACYDRVLPYDEPLDPPIPPHDAEWARERLRQAAKLATG
jgi:hypothetical protein